jgi:small GTP-binding protein
MAHVILQEKQRELLRQERQLASNLKACLLAFEETNAYVAALQQAIIALDELFLLVVVGEFNAGKSACINGLLHNEVLEEGVIPTTHQVTILRYGPERAQLMQEPGLLELVYPADFLRDISIVDTPGVNAVLLEHQRLTEEFVPRSDLILFITSVDRPFTQSERVFLEHIRAWGKKIVILLNKIDLFHRPGELDQVIGFIRENCKQLLGFQPDIFPISARLAEQSRNARGHQAIELWKQSRFDRLETYLFQSLDEAERIRLKLLSPLGVMQRVLTETQKAVEQRAKLLAEDIRTVTTIEDQLRLYGEDMAQNFHHRLNEIENIIINMRMRGDQFFQDTLRLPHLFDLLRSEHIQSTFEDEVLGDSATRIEQAVQEIIDWLVEQEHRLWQNVMEYLDGRRQVSLRRDEKMVGTIGRQFDYNRRVLLQSVAQTVNDVVTTYNAQAETRQLSLDTRKTVAQMAITGVSGIGLGALVATLIGGTLAADFTGLATGAILISLGLGILPLRRKRAQQNFDAKMEELQRRLHQALSEQFYKECNNSIQRIRDTLAPYTRFVRAEQEKTIAIREQARQLAEGLRALKGKVELL